MNGRWSVARPPFTIEAPAQMSRARVTALLTAVGYVVGAQVGMALKFGAQPVSPLWPPNAILLAGLLLVPARSWTLVVLATLPAHLAVQLGSGTPLLMSLCWWISNATEALIGAVCIRRVVGDELAFDRFDGGLAFVLGAGLLAAFLSSFLDAGFVALNGFGARPYWAVWQLRFLSNLLATLTLVPVIVIAARGGIAAMRQASRRRWVESALLTTGLIAAAAAVFVGDANVGTMPLLLSLPLPFLLWAAMRFGPGGTSAAMFAIAVIAIEGTVAGVGPFVGETENAAVHLQLFLLVTGVPLLLLATALAERRRVDDETRQTAQQIALTAAVVDLGFFRMEFATGKRWMSAQVRALHGIGPDDPIGPTSFTDPIHPEDRDIVMRSRSATIAKVAPFDMEYRIVRPDGSVRWVHSVGRVVEGPDGDQIVGVMADVTDRREAEHEMREQQRQLTHLSRLAVVGELSGAIAHELKQPLAAVLANAQAGIRMMQQPGTVDLDEIEAILCDIVEDDARAAAVLDRIRRLLRDEPIVATPLPLAGLIDDVLTLTRGELQARGVTAHVDVSPDLPRVFGDRVQLQQVLVNLVVNACEAIALNPAGNARELMITGVVDETGAPRLSITDTGPGIAVRPADRVFEPFVSGKAGGLGLGLAICRRVVNAHGGRLVAENAPGGGATFHLFLPVAVEAEPKSNEQLIVQATAARDASRRLREERRVTLDRIRAERQEREAGRSRSSDEGPAPLA